MGPNPTGRPQEAARRGKEEGMASERLVTPQPHPEDAAGWHYRPRSLREWVGQPQVRETLEVLLEAARQRGEPLEHVLFYGPPGLGKTTLAHILAHEMGVNIRVTAGPAIERPGDLAAILSNLRAGDVLFIDEIHRLPKAVEEILYPAMEDFALDVVLGKGPAARAVRLRLPRFTLIAATTRLALVSAPLRGRFGVVLRLDFYDEDALTEILRRAAHQLGIPATPEGLREIARRARGTPRIALRLLRRVRDYAQVRAQGTITEDVARQALAMLHIDELGLDEVDRRLLRTLIEKFGGGPVGLNTLAAALSEAPDTLMDVVEPYLLRLGLLERTAQGRVATPLAYRHLGYPPPPRASQPPLLET